mmetsp:Transcript_26309/g.67988  ORF Transcript_26309/g.67988 Transcript_26309/m.67988 type:complete len:199 (+) Transcript_26309:472-1068(+)
MNSVSGMSEAAKGSGRNEDGDAEGGGPSGMYSLSGNNDVWVWESLAGEDDDGYAKLSPGPSPRPLIASIIDIGASRPGGPAGMDTGDEDGPSSGGGPGVCPRPALAAYPASWAWLLGGSTDGDCFGGLGMPGPDGGPCLGHGGGAGGGGVLGGGGRPLTGRSLSFRAGNGGAGWAARDGGGGLLFGDAFGVPSFGLRS